MKYLRSSPTQDIPGADGTFGKTKTRINIIFKMRLSKYKFVCIFILLQTVGRLHCVRVFKLIL